MIFRTGHNCFKGDCDCNLYDQLQGKKIPKLPPLHEECDCYVETDYEAFAKAVRYFEMAMIKNFEPVARAINKTVKKLNKMLEEHNGNRNKKH